MYLFINTTDYISKITLCEFCASKKYFVEEVSKNNCDLQSQIWKAVVKKKAGFSLLGQKTKIVVMSKKIQEENLVVV